MFDAQWCERDEISIFLSIFAPFPFYYSIFLRQPFRKLLCPRHTHDRASSTCVSISCGCKGHSAFHFVLCHHFVFLHLNACLSVAKTAFGFGSQTHPIALHMLSAIFSERKGSFIFVQIVRASLAVLKQYPVKVSSSFFLNLNNILYFCQRLFHSATHFSLPKHFTL